MKALIDTNVIIDVFAKREPYFESSAAVLKLCGEKLSGYIIASQTTDIYYLLHRETKDAAVAKGIIKTLADNMNVFDVTALDVKSALNSEMSDYEDSLLAYCARRLKADYIITRNKKDFMASPVSAMTPTDFLNKFFS